MPKDSAEPFAEAAVLKNLRHPGIPVVYDLEEDSNFYYLIEEYLDGESLYACLGREGSLTKAKQISYGIQLCRIIYYLHSFEAYPILYLDLQPHNLLICQGTLKLIDFDQAVSAGFMKRADRRFGTRGFAAPEQYTEEPPDVRTDIYAIGALLYYMGTGQAPDVSETGEAGLWTENVSAGNSGLDAVILRCLKADREERYQSVWEIQEALLKLQAGTFTKMEMPFLKIAVAGSSHGMGTTHVSLCAASYLSQQGFSCLYKESNTSGAVRKMAATRNRVPDSCGIYHMEKWAMRPQYGPNVHLEEPYYEAVIEDFGTGLQPVLEEEYDLILLLCGGKDWELEDTISSVRHLARKENLRVIFNHVSPDDTLILPGDITSLHLFRFPNLSLSGKEENAWAFWAAVFSGTAAGEALGGRSRESRMAERRPGIWTSLQKIFSGLQRKRRDCFLGKRNGSDK